MRDMDEVMRVVDRWKAEAVRAGKTIARIVVAYEAGRDGFWIARELSSRGIEAHVMQPASIPVERKGRRAKTDRIDLDMLLRTLLAWLRGEPRVCTMVRVPQRRGGGCAASGARARQAGARARRAREPDPESVVPARDWRLPAAPEEGGGEAGGLTNSLRRGAAGADDGPVAAPDEAAQRGERTDRGDRCGARDGARRARSRPGNGDDPAAGGDLRDGAGNGDAAGS